MHKDIEYTVNVAGRVTRGLFAVSGAIALIPIGLFLGTLLIQDGVIPGLLFLFFVIWVCVRFIKWIQRNNPKEESNPQGEDKI